jgi:hypothetical protein
MTTAQTASNPFELMMNPESIFEAIARSDRLGRLKSRICRPLDKPLIAHADADEVGQARVPHDGCVQAASILAD